MATSIYITSAEGSSGKSTIALGILDALRARVERGGNSRPISRGGAERDDVLEILRCHAGIDFPCEESVGVTDDDVYRDSDEALATIVERYRSLTETRAIEHLSGCPIFGKTR